jgi:phosphatidylserine decarboxylase
MFSEIIVGNLLWSQGFTLLMFIIGIWILSFLIYRPLSYVVFFVLLFCIWFFRNPPRVCPELQYDKSILVCPADGKVLDIVFGDVGYGFRQKVSIFLSVFDVHVQRIPARGTISHTMYQQGAFTFAFLPKSSSLNEHNDVFVQIDPERRIMVRQIAGIVARRICCWVDAGDQVKAGDTFGMIRFGSRVEIFLPEEVTLAVGGGQRVYAGQTVLGRWSTPW